MKIKYYMQGIGIGIIFSALVFFLFINNFSMTNEEVIKRAKSLGMVMEEEKDIKALDDLIKGKKDRGESSLDSSSDGVDASNQGDNSSLGDKSKTEEDIQKQESDKNSDNNEGSSQETSADIDGEQTLGDGNQVDKETISPRIIEIEIQKGMSAEQIAKKLEQNGIIKDYQDFKQYLKDKGYTKNISYGTFHMEEDISYEKIVKTLVFE